MAERSPTELASRRFRILLAVAVALMAMAPLMGAPMIVPWVVTGLTWMLLLRVRGVAAAMSFCTTVIGVLFALVLTLIATAVVPIPAMLALCVVHATLGVLGALGMPDLSPVSAWMRELTLRQVLVTIAPFTGAAVWIGVRLASIALPQATEVAWATLNDGANSLLFGRQVIIDGGVRLGEGENPVPLAAAIVAAATMPGRPDSASAAHDIHAFVSAWSLLIVVLCIATGLFCRALLRDSRSAVAVVGPAVASLLPLSWLVSGLTLEYGYINVAPTVFLLVSAVLAFLTSRTHPALSFVVVVTAGMLVMISWSPLTLIPALLALAILIREWSALWRSTAVLKSVVVAVVVLALVFALVFVLPTFNASREAIESDVSFYPFRVRHLIVLFIAATVTAGGLWWTRRNIAPAIAVAAVSVGGGTAVGIFLYARRGLASLWAYYPYKALWFLMMMLLILAVVFALVLVADLTRRVWVSLASTALIGAGTVAFGAWANTVPGYGSMNAVQRVLSGAVLVDDAGDAVWTRIIELADGEPRGILWRSGDPNEAFISFWSVKLASPGFDDLELHVLAYTIDTSDVDDLCRFAEIVGPDLKVVTADGGLVAEVEKCANPDLIVTVE